MKNHLTLAAAFVAASFAPLLAADTGKDAAPAAPVKEDGANPADAAWKEVEVFLKGPAERATTREESIAIFTKHLQAFDEKSAAFFKEHPQDPRRWKLAVYDLRMDRTRTTCNVAPKSDADLQKLKDDISTASDADEEVKGYVSLLEVMSPKNSEEDFKKLAEAHTKAYPKYAGNAQIDRKLKTIEDDKAIKGKPLELSFTAIDGREVDLTKMRGKVILVDFWATWCGPCIGEIPNVVKTYNKLHDKGFEIVGISFDQDKAKLEAMTKDKSMPWPQFFDGEGWKNKFGQQYKINSIPRMWLIDKKGMVVDTNGREDLESKVEKLLAEQ